MTITALQNVDLASTPRIILTPFAAVQYGVSLSALRWTPAKLKEAERTQVLLE
jgi:hypothetical protein